MLAAPLCRHPIPPFFLPPGRQRSAPPEGDDAVSVNSTPPGSDDESVDEAPMQIPGTAIYERRLSVEMAVDSESDEVYDETEDAELFI